MYSVSKAHSCTLQHLHTLSATMTVTLGHQSGPAVLSASSNQYLPSHLTAEKISPKVSEPTSRFHVDLEACTVVLKYLMLSYLEHITSLTSQLPCKLYKP